MSESEVIFGCMLAICKALGLDRYEGAHVEVTTAEGPGRVVLTILVTDESARAAVAARLAPPASRVDS